MKRRAFLAGGATALSLSLAGCGSIDQLKNASAETTTPSGPEPFVKFKLQYHEERKELMITHKTGEAITEDNTRRVEIFADGKRHAIWAGDDGALGSFPIEQGDTVYVPNLEGNELVSIMWVGRDGKRVSLTEYYLKMVD